MGVRTRQALNTAGDDFLDMARYLIVGSMLAAAMQTLVPQCAAALGGTRPGRLGPGDAGAGLRTLHLLHGGPRSWRWPLRAPLPPAPSWPSSPSAPWWTSRALMFLGVFRRRIVVYLIVLPLLLTMFIGILWNLVLLS
ncbi:MAG: hypothetical protein R3A10_21735 [Caldilineaceae bacterium]